MPLSDSPENAEPRELLHLRDIRLRGYRRADGLFDIEAELQDTKTYGFGNQDRGWIEPGEPLHHMLARMTVDEGMVIVSFEAATERGPFAICPQAAPNFARLAGLRIGRGFLKAANERVGGTVGCTHLRERLQQMATVAVQTLYAAAHVDADAAQVHLVVLERGQRGGECPSHGEARHQQARAPRHLPRLRAGQPRGEALLAPGLYRGVVPARDRAGQSK